jgi:putative GTP pyrophosphokinase
MVSFAKPNYSKSRIKSAGKRIVKGIGTVEDNTVLENFRAAHAYVLNTFQMNARRHSERYSRTVGQRLKRRNTILDKLEREPSMPLYAMHDIAGCRIIFENENDLYEVRESLHNARFKHIQLNDIEKFDYIQNPKDTGYRGIHDVFEYHVDRLPGSAWNGLKVEIQFRTQAQHAWATAVEVADLITSNRIKFNDAKSYYLDYFRFASEIISRSSEGQKSCLPNIPNTELVDGFRSLDKRLNLLGTFQNLQANASSKSKFKKNSILIFKYGSDKDEKSLEILTFENVNRAIDRYAELEEEYGETADIVLVRGETEESIRDAFRNYFSDARAFVDLIDHGLKTLI